MAIRTLEQLEAALTTDLKWRRGEMYAFEKMVDAAREHERAALLRGALALVYAHWEGYVKRAGTVYLEYVSRKRLKLGELRPELAAVALRAQIAHLAEAKSSQSHSEIVSMLWDRVDDVVVIPYGSATIRTRANLNFATFESIMHSLGCDVSHHRGQEHLIDERLLGSRNSVAHGERDYVDFEMWKDLRTAVEVILADVRTMLSNSAVYESYRRSMTASYAMVAGSCDQ